jgi:hypothetical protein
LFIVLKADVVEDEELGFGAEIGHIADAGGFQVGFGLLGGAARVALIGFAGVGLDDRAMQAQRLFGVERVDIGRCGVGHQLHVGGFDRLPAGDRRAVEHEAFFEEVLVDLIGHDGHVLQLAARVGEADVDIGDVLVLDRLQNVALLIWLLPLFPLGLRSWIGGSERVEPGFAGADADRLFDGRDEDLAVADLVGLGGADDGLDGGVDLVVVRTTSIFTLGRKSTTYSAPR